MSLGAASEAVRDQVLRHDPLTGVFSGAYRDELVRFNVQDAFLENDISDDGLTRAFTHMSIRCNPGAPNEVPEEIMKPLFAADPDIVDLERRSKELHTKIKWEYRFINRAPKKIGKKYADLCKQLKNAKKSLEDEIEDAYRKDYFFRIHNEMMKRQLKRQLNKTVVDEEETEPNIEHQLAERTQLQKILCDFTKDLSPQDIVSREVTAINLMVALASRQEFQTRTRKPRPAPASKGLIETESPALDPFPSPDEFPVVCEKTQCIICIGNDRLSYKQRMRAFSRVSHMWDHVENVHLSKVPSEQRIICFHPVCQAEGLVLHNVIHFKNHVATVHKIDLRFKVFSN